MTIKKVKNKNKIKSDKTLSREEKEQLYKEFKARLKKEKELEEKAALDWQIDFEDRPRGKTHGSGPSGRANVYDNSEDRR